jgi:glycosyltransferase involved in cell wall biosynthesis
MQRIAIVRAPSNGLLTGGNVFNRRIVQQARRSGWPLQAVAGPLHRARAQAWDALVWDSLLMEHMARIGAERIALLLHYLPSLEPGLERTRAEALRAAEDHAARLAQLCIPTSRELAEMFAARWPGMPVRVCEPGVAAVFRRRRPRVARASAVLVTVANLLPAKGHEPLLACLERLGHRPWHWHVVGDGAMDPGVRARLQTRIRQAGLAGRVTFHGALPQRHVAATMRAADLLVQPSEFESYGMALAEAAAVGVPAVAFRVGAAQRLVRHGVTGFVAPGGDWDAFERYVRALLEDAGMRAEFEHNLAGVPVRRWDAALADFRLACEALR